MRTSVVVLDPTATAPSRVATSGPDLDQLAGRRIGIRHDALWKSFDWVTDEWSSLLQSDGAEVQLWRSQSRAGPDGDQIQAQLDDFLGPLDAVICGLANCGSCTMLTVQDALEGTAKGMTSVAVATERFGRLASSLADAAGHPALRLQLLPSALESLDEGAVRDAAREAYPMLRKLLGVAT
jgi:hypothetical protein